MNKVKEYYRKKESRWGYRLLLKGIRHFGYYPALRQISHRQALIEMMDQVGARLEVKPGAKVLDAGCGEGKTAIYISEKYDCQVTGIDLLPESIAKAKSNAKKANAQNVEFKSGDFSKLPFKKNQFDALYALETFVHSRDAGKTLKEFARVLKKGARLVIIDYETTPVGDISDNKIKKSFIAIERGTSAPGLNKQSHGYFNRTLPKRGFKQVKTTNLTPNVMPMLKLFKRLTLPFHFWVRLLKLEEQLPNLTIGRIGSKVARVGWWKIVAVSAQKK